MLTVGGLFSGIGGWELGLERAGMRVLWHCEADPYARAVLERHWPGVPCYPDVRELRRADVEPVDVLAGGFPCQDVSVAGAGAGIDGARSGLWSEYARLVGELRPRYVLVENVAALLGRGLGRVLGDLAALGYDAEWDCLPAIAFGAPHQRDRVWLVAYPHGRRGLADGRERPEVGWDQHARRDGAHGQVANSQSDGCRQGRSRRPDSGGSRKLESALQDVADAERFRRDGRTRIGRPSDPDRPAPQRREGAGQPERCDSTRAASLRWHGSTPWATEPDVGRVAHGIPARVDRLRCLGNALVPQIAEWIGCRVIQYEEQRANALTVAALGETRNTIGDPQ